MKSYWQKINSWELKKWICSYLRLEFSKLKMGVIQVSCHKFSIRYRNAIYNSTESLANLSPIIWKPVPTCMKETKSFHLIKIKNKSKLSKKYHHRFRICETHVSKEAFIWINPLGRVLESFLPNIYKLQIIATSYHDFQISYEFILSQYSTFFSIQYSIFFNRAMKTNRGTNQDIR